MKSKRRACQIASLMSEGSVHQQTLCQNAQNSFDMKSSDFWESFRWLKTGNHISLKPGTKSSYTLTPSGRKLAEADLQFA